MTCDAVDVACL